MELRPTPSPTSVKPPPPSKPFAAATRVPTAVVDLTSPPESVIYAEPPMTTAFSETPSTIEPTLSPILLPWSAPKLPAIETLAPTKSTVVTSSEALVEGERARGRSAVYK